MTCRPWAVVAAVIAAIAVSAGCTSDQSTPQKAVAAPSTSEQPTLPVTTHSPTTKPTHRPKRTHPAPTPTSTSPKPTTAPRKRGAPVIVIDPGHSPSVHGTDPATGLDTSDYENEPEMHDVYDVALLVRAKLEAAGYRVVMTKPSVDALTTLGKRAYIANRVHAALALSIHDQAGSNGGIPFDSGNNNVYYQAVGDYRENPNGKKIYFTDSRLAAISKRYGEIFQRERTAIQGHPVNLLSNTGYDLGGRGLQSGNIWIVQLLSHVPWIYNEAGGNSAGRVGLDRADKHTYADALVASIEHCVPVPH